MKREEAIEMGKLKVAATNLPWAVAKVDVPFTDEFYVVVAPLWVKRNKDREDVEIICMLD